MKRYINYFVIFSIIFLVVSCGPVHAKDTNSENEDISILEGKIDSITKLVEDQNVYNKILESELDEYRIKEQEYSNKLENVVEIEKFHFPLPEEYKNNITSYSGYRDSNKLNTGGVELHSNMHYGIDYGCPDKTPVYAAKDGYVETVYPGYYNGPKWKGDRVYGGMIIIHHADGTSTLYGHLSYTEVREGTEVKAGDEIGWSGGVRGRRASGATTGPHLHFAMYYDLENMFY